MTQKLFTVLFTILMAALSVSAQYSPTNARIRSIAGIYTIDDITNVYRYAAYMSRYTDDIQVTFSTPMLGIKSIGEIVTLGAYVRNGLVLDTEGEHFYGLGRTFLNNSLDPDITRDPTYIPHALLGFKAGAVTLGFDLFIEWANTRLDSKTSGTPTTTTSMNSTLRNPGFIGSLLLDIKSFPVSLKAGIAFPGISGVSEINDGTTTTEYEYKSDKGFYMELGGEIGLSPGSIRVTAGADYILESYAFQVNSGDPTNEYALNRLAIFSSLQKEAFDNGLWAVLYQMKFRARKNDAAESTTPDITDKTFIHHLVAGIENGWENVWLFDNIFLRGGVVLQLVTEYDKSENNDTKTTSKNQKVFTAGPSVGFGVNKGLFELDVQLGLNPGSGGWEKLLTGPGVATVTGTLRF